MPLLILVEHLQLHPSGLLLHGERSNSFWSVRPWRTFGCQFLWWICRNYTLRATDIGIAPNTFLAAVLGATSSTHSSPRASTRWCLFDPRSEPATKLDEPWGRLTCILIHPALQTAHSNDHASLLQYNRRCLHGLKYFMQTQNYRHWEKRNTTWRNLKPLFGIYIHIWDCHLQALGVLKENHHFCIIAGCALLRNPADPKLDRFNITTKRQWFWDRHRNRLKKLTIPNHCVLQSGSPQHTLSPSF